MKRLLLALLFPILFIGCKEETIENQDAFSIVGKKYYAYVYDYQDSYLGTTSQIYYVYRFIDNNTAELTARKNSPNGALFGSRLDSCTYTFNYPNLSITRYGDYSTQTFQSIFIDEKTFRETLPEGFYEYILMD